MRRGKERTLSVQVTREESRSAAESYVITLDDITDLLSAQRTGAWADVARRIAQARTPEHIDFNTAHLPAME